MESDLAELGLDHARIDAADPDAAPENIDTQAVGDGADRMLGGAVDVAARVDLVAGDGADVDDPGRAEKDATSTNGSLARYRIEVGRSHGVEPKHIVGAIANEANIKSRDIGQIKIFNDYCLVDLPKSMPPPLFRHLQKVWVCGQQLQISPAEDRQSPSVGKPKRQGGPRKNEGRYPKQGKTAPRSRRGKQR